MGTSIEQTLRRAIRSLAHGGVESPRFEAEVLLADLLGVDRLRLRTHSDTTLDADQSRSFELRIRRRGAREPAAHILKYRDFHRYRFAVSPAVLIPRPETELIVELVLGKLRPRTGGRILDLCTGSGCIGITLLKELAATDVVLTDLCESALAVARENLERVAPEATHRCTIYQGDLDAALPERERTRKFSLIVANPPYIGLDEAPSLAPEVREFEPSLALFHEDPPGLYQRIFTAGRDLLTEDGSLVLELSPRWAPALQEMARAQFPHARLHKDYGGNYRVLVAGYVPTVPG